MKLIKKMAFMLIVAGLVLNLTTSCDKDDPNYENVIPPVVEELKESSIGGVITAISGDPISGATVTAVNGSVSLTATTDSKGMFTFEKLTVTGTYTMTATATDKLDATGSVSISQGAIALWNAQLANKGKEVTVSQTEETTVTVETETIKGNEEAKVTVEAEIPAAAVEEEDVVITITPIYSDDDVKTKATVKEDGNIVGTKLSCNKPDAKLKKPIALNYQLDATVATSAKAQKYSNGKWQEVSKNVSGGNVLVNADEFTSYRLIVSVTISTSNSSEPISFSQASFDNLYGSNDMTVGTVNYTYKQGAEVSATASGAMGAFLREILGRELSASSVNTMTGSYPVNVTLPIGTALTLSGIQAVNNISVSCNSVSVSGKAYGQVTTSASTYNRSHTGGGSNNN